MGAATHGGKRKGSGRKPLSPQQLQEKAELKALKLALSDDPSKKVPQPALPMELPRQPKKGWTLSAPQIIQQSRALAKAMYRTEELNPFRAPQFPPAAMPKDKKMRMALDQSAEWAGQQWAQAGAVFGAVAAEGLQFLGYPFLSELAQRPEYRVISETRADDATRRWIDFDVVGAEQGEKEEEQDEAQQEMIETAGMRPDPAEEAQQREDRVKKSGKAEKIKRIKDEITRLDLRDKMYRTCRDDGLFGRSHLFIDVGQEIEIGSSELGLDIGDGRSDKSKAAVGIGSLRDVVPVEPVWAYPMIYNAINPLKTNFYNPDDWYVMGTHIHSSRLLRFVGSPVPDLLKAAYAFGGLSMSQLAKPYVDIWLKTRQSVGQLIHSFSVMVLLTDLATMLQPGATGGAGELLARVAAFNALRDNQGTFVVNKDTEDFKNVAASLSGLHELQAQAQEHMMSVARIPDVKFTGINPTGLNASSEGVLQAYYDTIAAYQNRFIRPNLTRIVNFVQLSLFGEVDPEITFDFEPLWELTEKEKAELQKQEADRDEVYVNMGALSNEEVRKRIIDDPHLPYADLDPEDVPQLKQEEQQGLIPEGAGRGLEAVLGEPGQQKPGGAGQEPPANENEPPMPFGHDATDPVFAFDAWEESKHPRGQPGNAGEFAKGGGGSSASKWKGPGPEPWWLKWEGGEEPKPPKKPLDPAKLKRIGPQMGSNPGGIFEDKDGKKYYVKKGQTKDHVRNELTAAALMALAGAPTLHYRDVAGAGHIATEMEKLDKDNARKLSPEEVARARKDFVAHAWLANYDAVGTGGDNLVTIRGVPTAIDLGGALEYRARGAPKGSTFGAVVTEIDTMRDPHIAPDASKIFGGMTPAELQESAERVTSIPDDEIRDVVDEMGGKAELADKLVARKHQIAERAKTFGAEGDPTKPQATVVFAKDKELPVAELNGTKFEKWAPPAGVDWNDVDGQADLVEDAMPEQVAVGKHGLTKQLSSGLIIREPDGRVWLTRPKGMFGGYANCVTLDSEILTKRGMLKYNEVVLGDETLGFDLRSGTLRWTPVLEIVKFEDAEVVRYGGKQWSVTCTPDHRWVCESPKKSWSMREAKALIPKGRPRHSVLLSAPMSGDYVGNGIDPIDAAVIGWLVTDGNVYRNNGAPTLAGRIAQQKERGVAALDRLLATVPHTKTVRIQRGKRVCHYHVRAVYMRAMFARTGWKGSKSELSALVTNMPLAATEAFFRAAWEAEGLTSDKRGNRIALFQKDGPVFEAMTIAAYKLGYLPLMSSQSNGMRRISACSPHVKDRGLRCEAAGRAAVWCVRTGLGTWTMRQGNSIVVTGNTFPKGRVEPGLSMQANAIKEAWEETGIKGRIVSVLGDAEGDVTVTRYYLAERQSGDPADAGPESDAAVLAPPDRLNGLLNRGRDREIAEYLHAPVAKDASRPRTLYVNRPLLNGDDVVRWARDQGFAKTLAPDDMHVTVAFSREPLDWNAVPDGFDNETVPEAGPGRERSVERLGDEGAVVLRFDSGDLARRWRQFRDAGASWDHAGYKPHVTFTMDAGDVDLAGVEPYGGELQFGPEEFQEVGGRADDWADKARAAMIATDAWEEGKHPRGGSKNKGQFTSGAGGGGGGAKGGGQKFKSPKEALAAGAYKSDPKNEGGRSDLEEYRAKQAAGTQEKPLTPEEQKRTKAQEAQKVFGRHIADQLAMASPKDRAKYEKHVAQTREFFSADGVRRAIAKAVHGATQDVANAMIESGHEAALIPLVHHAAERAVEIAGMASIPGATITATAVAAYAAHHLLEAAGLTKMKDVKRLLSTVLKGAASVVTGSQDVARQVAAFERRQMGGMTGPMAYDASDGVTKALIELIAALDRGGDEDDEGGEEPPPKKNGGMARDEFEEGKHPRVPAGQPGGGEFAKGGGGGGEGGGLELKGGEAKAGEPKNAIEKEKESAMSYEDFAQRLDGLLSNGGEPDAIELANAYPEHVAKLKEENPELIDQLSAAYEKGEEVDREVDHDLVEGAEAKVKDMLDNKTGLANLTMEQIGNGLTYEEKDALVKEHGSLANAVQAIQGQSAAMPSPEEKAGKKTKFGGLWKTQPGLTPNGEVQLNAKAVLGKPAFAGQSYRSMLAHLIKSGPGADLSAEDVTALKTKLVAALYAASDKAMALGKDADAKKVGAALGKIAKTDPSILDAGSKEWEAQKAGKPVAYKAPPQPEPKPAAQSVPKGGEYEKSLKAFKTAVANVQPGMHMQTALQKAKAAFENGIATGDFIESLTLPENQALKDAYGSIANSLGAQSKMAAQQAAKSAAAAPASAPPKMSPAGATAAEITKAKKTVPLQLQYVPNAPQTPAAQKLVDEFNAKWGGKEVPDDATAMTKIADFKALQEKMVPLMSEAQKEAKAQAEKQAKEYAAQAAKTKADLEAEAQKHAESNNHYMEELGIGPEEAEAFAGLLQMHGGSTQKDLLAQFKDRANEMQHAAPNISGFEAALIADYKGSSSFVNTEMRKPEAQYSPEQWVYRKVLNSALSKLPGYKGETIRNSDIPTSIQMRYATPGKIVMESGFTGTSKKKPNGIGGGNTRWYVTGIGKRGADIQHFFGFSDEQEVLYRGLTGFKINKVEGHPGGKMKVWMTEVDSGA